MRMQMCCATYGLHTIPISSRRCSNTNRRRPRSWWSSSTTASGRTSRNLSCSFSPCSPSHSTLRSCWFTYPWTFPQADQIIAWCRNAMKGKNFYIPMAIVEVVNQVKGVNVNVIDHCDFQHPCYVDWDWILKKHFNQLPTWDTFNYIFEFD